MTAPTSLPEPWPSLPLDAWRDTDAALHLGTKIVGKIRSPGARDSTTPGTQRST